MDVFYKGADIEIDFESYVDNEMSAEQNLSNYDIDIALYTNNNKVVIASTKSGSDISITRKPPNKINVLLRKGITKDMDSGALRIELRLTDITSQISHIAAMTAIQLEDCEIGQI